MSTVTVFTEYLSVVSLFPILSSDQKCIMSDISTKTLGLKGFENLCSSVGRLHRFLQRFKYFVNKLSVNLSAVLILNRQNVCFPPVQ